MPETALPGGNVLGFDFGLRRIGIAIGQTATYTASALETVRHGKSPDWQAIDRLVGEWDPKVLLVGLPLDAQGEETDMSRAARRFGAALHQRYSQQVVFADERLTSQAAASRFIELRANGKLRRKDAGQLDAVAARIILENWFLSLRD
jgi:putative Holliday junction resolvase